MPQSEVFSLLTIYDLASDHCVSPDPKIDSALPTLAGEP